MSDAEREPPALRIRSPRDFWGGLAMVAIALLALYAARDLGGAKGISFGSGTAPRLFAGLLLLAGIGVAFLGLRNDGPAIGRFAFRGPLLVSISILAFAVMVRPFGLVVTSFVTYLIASAASRETRPVSTVIAAGLMTLFCTLVFFVLLELPFRLWPAALG
jgi:putative tricarboxylic transport membrane protein